ncbi:hypothetical protein [Zunongwangia sp. HGR-M22]|uniref:hypothetical protein n=1 Tax=Zunongwangia sp. HGR-M22 TaxID=3015168 RepID=UPI0022DE0256|nr:hypothetical protein [Zunongwangia sp. HGR-M22]WBL26791.1 hypothetical protein PBT91_05885 [Zunongwangia sp. HGR-M22]
MNAHKKNFLEIKNPQVFTDIYLSIKDLKRKLALQNLQDLSNLLQSDFLIEKRLMRLSVLNLLQILEVSFKMYNQVHKALYYYTPIKIN